MTHLGVRGQYSYATCRSAGVAVSAGVYAFTQVGNWNKIPEFATSTKILARISTPGDLRAYSVSYSSIPSEFSSGMMEWTADAGLLMNPFSSCFPSPRAASAQGGCTGTPHRLTSGIPAGMASAVGGGGYRIEALSEKVR